MDIQLVLDAADLFGWLQGSLARRGLCVVHTQVLIRIETIGESCGNYNTSRCSIYSDSVANTIVIFKWCLYFGSRYFPFY